MMKVKLTRFKMCWYIYSEQHSWHIKININIASGGEETRNSNLATTWAKMFYDFRHDIWCNTCIVFGMPSCKTITYAPNSQIHTKTHHHEISTRHIRECLQFINIGRKKDRKRAKIVNSLLAFFNILVVKQNNYNFHRIQYKSRQGE